MKNNLGRWALVLSAALLASSPGRAFTYIYDDETNLPIKWPAGNIGLEIKLGTTPTLIDGTNYSTSAQAAAQTWNAVIGSAQIVSTIAPVASATDHNRVNELVFDTTVFGEAFGATTIAITTTWVIGSQRTESDIIFNSAKTWDSYDGPRRGNTIDLQRVVLHELGHSLGLGHPDQAGQSVTAIMNSLIGDLDTLTDDDNMGAQNLYGPPGVPANDNFANATTITLQDGTLSLSGYNTNATRQIGEPAHASNAGSGGRSVWWKWTAQSGGTMTMDTNGSYFDTTLGVYTGTSVTTLTSIATNDDIDSGTILSSRVTFNAVAGNLYSIAVDGYSNTPETGAEHGRITLNLNFAATGPTIPVITNQPSNQTVTVGGSTSFSVTATSTTAITYQWFLNNVAVGGATGATLALSNIQAANAGSYKVTLTNTAGSITSNAATLTVNVPVPAPSPSPSPSGGGGGGGGGGAPSLWFCLALSLLAWGRRFLRLRP